MADDNCLTTIDKKWTSWLTPDGGSKEEDGTIVIKKVSNKLKGKHEKSDKELEDLECDGTQMSFNRPGQLDDGTPVRIFYKNGVISGPTNGKLHIHGRYTVEVVHNDLVTQKSAKRPPGKARGKGTLDVPSTDPGDWQAEKPVA